MDINDIIRSIVLAGLSEAPKIGWLLSSLVGSLWPESAEDIWDEIESKVEALIQQQLAQYEYQQIQQDLTGLQNVINDYTSAVATSQSDPSLISQYWVSAATQFDSVRPHFMAQGYEVLLLPLMAQMANLHLSLIRDGIQFGAKWGWTAAEVAAQETKIGQLISTYSDWASTWYQNGLATYGGSGWPAQNTYIRQMTLGVTDFAYYWSSFDPAKNPGNKTLPCPTREIYSDPIGYEQDYPIVPVVAPPTRLSNVAFYGFDFIGQVPIMVGAQNAYDGTWGPAMGYINNPGVTSAPPLGWNGAIAHDNPIVIAGGSAGPGGSQNGGWTSIWLQFKDGSKIFAGNTNAANTYTLQFDGHILSSVTVLQPDPQTGFIPDGVVYGFRFEDAY
ncbi:MAG: insecticidal delta-endotoxin Cry8Ea1 family protein [Pseudolabrys sp.]